MQTTRLLLVFILLFIASTPEARAGESSLLERLYPKSTSYHNENRNPIIIIPGIFASRLIDGETQEVVWDIFGKKFSDYRSKERALKLTLPMRYNVPIKELRGNVFSSDVLQHFEQKQKSMLPMFRDYISFIKILQAAGYRDESLSESGAVYYGSDFYTAFQFDYDWRRTTDENAARLHEYILEKKAYLQKEYKKRFGAENEEIKFDIIAFNTGGLIARYYLRYGGDLLPTSSVVTPKVTWAGSAHVRQAILLGPPNAGTLNVLQWLSDGVALQGKDKAIDPLTLATMPSVFELLPRQRHRVLISNFAEDRQGVSVDDLNFWKAMEWGLAATKESKLLKEMLPRFDYFDERYQIALDHLQKNLAHAKQLQNAMDVQAPLPEGLELYLFAGDGVSTAAQAMVHYKKRRIEIISEMPGDGLVTRQSALMDERVGGNWSAQLRSPIDWTHSMFFYNDRNQGFSQAIAVDNFLYLLLEKPQGSPTTTLIEANFEVKMPKLIEQYAKLVERWAALVVAMERGTIKWESWSGLHQEVGEISRKLRVMRTHLQSLGAAPSVAHESLSRQFYDALEGMILWTNRIHEQTVLGAETAEKYFYFMELRKNAPPHALTYQESEVDSLEEDDALEAKYAFYDVYERLQHKQSELSASEFWSFLADVKYKHNVFCKDVKDLYNQEITPMAKKGNPYQSISQISWQAV